MIISFLIPVCSRNQTYASLADTPLIKKFMRGFESTKDKSFTYRFFVGVDDNDEFYMRNLPELEKNFEVVILTDCQHKPAKAWNRLLKAAYEADSDYFFQIGDDVQLLTPNWSSKFISRLQMYDNIGVVGPCEPRTHEARKMLNMPLLIENAFIHRKHYEIFNTLFHEEIDNWYCDNWITSVYDTFGRMKIFTDIHYDNDLRCSINSNRYDVKEEPKLNEYINQGVRTLARVVRGVKIGLNMIVKNEAHVILQGLKSILPLIDTYVIVDTGSTDNTKDVIKTFFDSKGVFGYIYDSEWKDFGSNRSEALKLCEGKMDYAIVLDADDLINFPQNGKEKLTDILLREKPNAVMMLIDQTDLKYHRTQIFKMGDGWRYSGVLHEYPTNNKDGNKIKKLPENFFMSSRRLGHRSMSGDKMKGDIQVLLNAIEKEPKNDRYIFYLAQSYRDDGNILKAIEYYKKRAEMGGWNEEVYVSLYQVAACYINLGNQLEAEYWGQRATLVHPERGEALYLLAKAFRESGNFYKAYHYIEKGRKLTYPHNDVLFIETFPYEGGFEYEAIIVEYYIFPDKRKGLKTCFRYLSKSDIHKQNVLSNMRFYIEKIKGVEKEGVNPFSTFFLSLSLQSLPKFFSLFEESSLVIEIKNELYCLLKFSKFYYLFAVVNKDHRKVARWCLPFYFNNEEVCTGIRKRGDNSIECSLSSSVVVVNLDDIEWLHPENF